MKKLISCLLYIIIIGAIGLGVYAYFYKPAWLDSIPWLKKQVLTAEQIVEKQKACLARLNEGKKITDAIKAKNQMVTEPKMFFSPVTNSCIATYLVRDMSLPENSTFNVFIIYDLDHHKRLFEKGDGAITDFVSYLDKIKALGGK